MADETGGPYRIDCSQVMLDWLRELARRATARGELARYHAALSTAYERMRNDPLNWGERLYHSRGRRAPVFHGAVTLLHVHYAVLADISVVVLFRAEVYADDLQSGNGFSRRLPFHG